ncbi:SpoIIE family protein phosphatase [Limnospira fusiformis SAG 85.79]|nr:protein serine/threonine phosphatase [Arthrospira platensis C1]QJB25797.1 SpoIIE family protein phosphatase [Limnospira fusiformis SAG 85.79]QNH56147.1 MAG: protein phosphatase 2C domain-containing protein [Limnospira indica BM01]UWU47699.1 protein phosphatase [Arthrospira platensis C1]
MTQLGDKKLGLSPVLWFNLYGLLNGLVISENTCLQIGDFVVRVAANLGQSNDRIHYFKVSLENAGSEHPQLGLLRVGSATGLLQQELQLRETLADYSLVAPILAQIQVPDLSKIVQEPLTEETIEADHITPELTAHQDHELSTLSSPDGSEEIPENSEDIEQLTNETETAADTAESITENQENQTLENTAENITDNQDLYEGSEPETDEGENYLEPEYYPEENLAGDEGDRLLVLTEFPHPERVLSQWLKNSPNPLEVLKAITPICQLFWYFHQRHWCAIDINPDWLEIGQPIRCFDLTGVYPEDTPMSSGVMGNYCAPELSSHPIPSEKSSVYTIGALLYHGLYGREPDSDFLGVKKCDMPHLSQLLTISLSAIPDERFSLSQLRGLVIETRKLLGGDRVNWEIASESTLGLSPRRLQNEDSYGIAQINQGASEQVILAALADGMGGMAAGEVASRLAVKTVIDGFRQEEENISKNSSQWLISIVDRANSAVSEAVHNGGTTLSLALIESRKLAIAHVGDSRIYRVSDGKIEQLSEDHSLVALLVASGQISAEESLEHPDRNVLTKSLGSKPNLSPGYVQTKSDIQLQDGDLILLCSDGVWDLISNEEFIEIFSQSQPLQTAVNEAINLVLKRDAPDNATLLALRCSITPIAVKFNRVEQSLKTLI